LATTKSVRRRRKKTAATVAVLATTTTLLEESNLESCNLPECIIHWVRQRRLSGTVDTLASQTRQSQSHNCKCLGKE